MKIKSLLNKVRHFKSLKWGGYMVLVNLIKQITLIPIFLSFLDKEVYSLWLIVISIVLLIRTMNLGQLNYSSNWININFFNKKDVSLFINNAIGANIILFFLQLLIGVIISLPIVFSTLSGFSVDYLVEKNFTLFFLFLMVSGLSSQLFSLFYLRLLEPLGLISLRIKYDTIREFIEILILIISIILFKNLLFISFFVVVYNLVYTFIVYRLVKYRINIILKFGKINFGNSVKIILNSMPLLFSFILEKLYENGLIIFISSIFNPLLVPVFATTRTISNLAMRFSLVISEPLMPDLQKDFSNKNDYKLIDNLKYYWRLTFLPILLLFLFLIPFIESLFNIWTINKLDFNLKLFFWIFLSIFFTNYSSVISQYFRRINYAKYLILFNITKTISTIIGLYFINFNNSIETAGIAIFLGELLSCLLLLFMFYKIKGIVFVKNISFYFIASLLVSIASISLLIFDNYFIFYFLCISLIISLITYYVKTFILHRKSV